MERASADDTRFFSILAAVLGLEAVGAAMFETVEPRALYGSDQLLATLVTFGVTAGVIVYVLPALIATWRQKRNALAIGALNLLLGWTLVGWVVSLVWALLYEAPASPAADTREYADPR